ncbi:MAG: hypothetical protein ACXAC7_11790 [Candidatus Hodarchaeales archaeon]
MYRSPKEIIALFELTIESYFEHSKDALTAEEKAILDKLSEWKVKLEPQLMHIFESAMSPYDFKDILRQTMKPVIDSVFEQAKANGVVTSQEQKLLDHIVQKLNIE